jgi:hypothetical protein
VVLLAILFIDIIFILFIDISNVIPPSKFPLHKSPIPSSSPYFHEGAPLTPIMLQHPNYLLLSIIKPPQDQGAPLPMVPDEAILYYISSWSHGSPPHLYSLVGGLVPGNFGV